MADVRASGAALRLSALIALGAATQVHAAECEKLQHLKFGHVEVLAASLVAAGTPAPTVEDPPPAKVSYCRIEARSTPSPDSDIRIELWVPEGEHWNGKFEQVGNGGFGGAMPYRLMSYALSLGYAVAGTDDGHRGASADASWALHHPEKVKDLGWRAIDETARSSKQLLERLTARPAAKSYFFGCSDGGREALMMAQRFPTYFDGIIAGAPESPMTRLFTGGALQHQAAGGPPANFSEAQLVLLQRHVLESCGNGATYLKDPRRCHVDLAPLRCAGASTDSCLTDAEIKTATVLYEERVDPVSGKPLYAFLPGAEGVKGSWDVWLTLTDPAARNSGSAFVWNYFAYLALHDPQLDLLKLKTADLARAERSLAPIVDSASPDLTAFKAHGGKLIQYHGWNDPAIPPGYSLEYRERMTARTPGAADFYRLYMVPGMLHCFGGDAPTQVDWQAALVAWVEKAQPPEQLTAADGKGGTQLLYPVGDARAAGP